MTINMKNDDEETAAASEQLIIIPSSYVDEDVVPICIRTSDDSGRPVHSGWIEAVRPVAPLLRRLARQVLRDEWRVSELTEGSVHSLSARFGPELGRTPSARIYADAGWRAQDMAVGGRRARATLDVTLLFDTFALIADPFDFAQDYENRDYLDRLEERLERTGQTDTLIMVQLFRRGSEDEIAAVFGAKRNSRARNALAKRFRRGLNKALKQL